MSSTLRFCGRFSGIVTYTDDTHDQFAAHVDEQGNVSVNAGIGSSPNSSNQAIVEVQSENNNLEDMLALVSSTLALTPLGSAAKVVNGSTMHLSGRVARVNDTWEDYAVQFDRKAGGNFILNSSGTGGTVAAYTESPTATLESWFESLVAAATVP